MHRYLFFVVFSIATLGDPGHAVAARPNILWFVVDDMSADFACYQGESAAVPTPHVDRLAREGVRFTDAHVTAPVCSTCRSAFMLGMHQASVGSQNHRMTGPPIRLPEPMVPVPVLFQRAGYYTANGDGLRNQRGKVRKKTDYNFVYDANMYDGVDWEGRKPGQPFFMQIQMAGGKLRGASEETFRRVQQQAKEVFGESFDPAEVRLPPYYPEDAVLRRDWAAYLDSVRLTDHHVGQILKRLEAEGILDDTLIVFMTDHGISHARGKQFNYREGTHIPFVVRGPGLPAGQVRTDPIEHIDMTALSLAAARLPIPDWMQAKDVLAADYQPREVVFAARDRCDETIDFIRSARTAHFLYIRNYQPFRPHLQPSRYKDNKLLLEQLRRLRNAGKLNRSQLELLFRASRPGEELYDLASDPFEMRNVAKDPQFARELADMRQRLDLHLVRTHDAGFLPEPTSVLVAGQEGITVAEFCRRGANYPLANLVRLANRAISREPAHLADYRKLLSHHNETVRYWALQGIQNLGGLGKSSQEDVRARLTDKNASVRIAAASCLANWGEAEAMSTFLLQEAHKAHDDAHALWALDALKYLDRPQTVAGSTAATIVKGQYSGRAFDYLSKGGRVFGSGVNDWKQ